MTLPRAKLWIALALCIATLAAWQTRPTEFTQDLGLSECTFSATGRTPYFVLEAGHVLTLEDGKGVRLVITVLGETEVVNGITTRIVEERESDHGQLVEVSRNYFAICSENKSVYYFGEAVDMYKSGKVVGHDGAWRHGVNGAKAGLMMPALPLIGARYYQEMAPRVAMDRAEILATNGTLKTPYGALTRVLETRESTPLEPAASELKSYAPGLGIVRDADLLLVSVTKAATAR